MLNFQFFIYVCLVLLNFLDLYSFNLESTKPGELKNGCILLSSPKSGNTWTRYFIQYLTEYDARLVAEEGVLERVLNPPFEMDPSSKKYFLIKSHEIMHDYSMMKSVIAGENLRLILLVRNYKELIGRYSTHLGGGFDPGICESLIRLIENDSWHYFNNLKCYDSWEEDKKLLVYYEDLMEHPDVEIARIAHFLIGEESPRFPAFWKEYEYHRQKSLATYNHFAESRSQGLDLFFHRRNLPKEYSTKIEEVVFSKYPMINQKYLYRYADQL